MEQEANPWKTTHITKAYENAWIRLEPHDVIKPNGEPRIYGKVHFKNQAIAILPIDNEGNTYLVGQYRYTIDTYSWELPEGGCQDESTLDAAKRELKEGASTWGWRPWKSQTTYYNMLSLKKAARGPLFFNQ